MSEFRKPSIANRFTYLQDQAWQQEHIALQIKAEGYPTYANYHMELATSLRQEDIHNKIVELFDRSDAQNAVLDGVAQAKSQGHDIPIFEPQLDYSLMQQ